MAIDEKAIRAVHEYVRELFKGKKKSSKKSTNKIYGLDAKGSADLKLTSAMQEKMVGRNANAVRASALIRDLRKSDAFQNNNLFAYGSEVLAQDDVAGNCVEMATAAAAMVVGSNIGSAWFAGIQYPGDHVFCLVDNGVDYRPPCIGGEKGYTTHGAADSWVIDPWANVCCKMRDYEAQFTAKMQQWSGQRKRIKFSSPGEATRVMDPASSEYLTGFRKGEILYMRVYADDKRPRTSSRSCVIL